MKKKLFFCVVVTVMCCSCDSTKQISEPLDIKIRTSNVDPVSPKPKMDVPIDIKPVEIRRSPI